MIDGLLVNSGRRFERRYRIESNLFSRFERIANSSAGQFALITVPQDVGQLTLSAG